MERYLYDIMMKNQIGNVKQCKALIKHGYVVVNDIIIDDQKYKVSAKDRIVVDGKQINSAPYVYYMMNKPKGYICANHDRNHLCVLDLIDNKDCYCLGRLDKDTTGLLLLTNDKSLSKRLLLPENHIYKTYFVTLNNILNDDLEDIFLKGVIIDKDIVCKKAYLKRIDDYHCYVTIREGRYHQIKKMFLSCHNEVIELKRIRFKDLVLDADLKEGQYRSLFNEEIESLYEVG